MSQSIAGTDFIAFTHKELVDMPRHHIRHTVFGGIGLAKQHLLLRMYGKQTHEGDYGHCAYYSQKASNQCLVILFHILLLFYFPIA